MECHELISSRANCHYYGFALIFGNHIISLVLIIILSRNRMKKQSKKKYFCYSCLFLLGTTLFFFVSSTFYSRCNPSQKTIKYFSSHMTFFFHGTSFFYGICWYLWKHCKKFCVIVLHPAFWSVKSCFYFRQFLLHTQKLTEWLWQTDFGKKHRKQLMTSVLPCSKASSKNTFFSRTFFKGVRRVLGNVRCTPGGKPRGCCIQLELMGRKIIQFYS